MGIPPRKTVQIVGAAPLSDARLIEGAERWVFNASYKLNAAGWFTRAFHLHPFPMIWALQPEAWAYYATCGQPVYLLEPHADIPTSVRFPLEALQHAFACNAHNEGEDLEQCFNCSLDFLIAFALYEGFEHIDLVGIHLLGQVEYEEQRASVQYWMGRARGMGRTITVSRSSGLATVPILYGYNLITGYPAEPGKPRPTHGHPYSTWPVPNDTTSTVEPETLLRGAFEQSV